VLHVRAQSVVFYYANGCKDIIMKVTNIVANYSYFDSHWTRSSHLCVYKPFQQCWSLLINICILFPM